MQSDDERHREFQDQYNDSESDAAPKAFIGRWLQGRFIQVHMPSSTLAPTHADWEKHRDKGDIFCRHGGLGPRSEWLRLEVKGVISKLRQFTCAADFKFSDFFVCRKGSHDDADPKPIAYLQVSADLCYCGLQMVCDSAAWTFRETPDEKRPGYMQLTYCCPKSIVHFFDLRQPGMPKPLIQAIIRAKLLLAGDPRLRPPGFLPRNTPVTYAP